MPHWKIGQDSYSKCVVYFKDGNTRSFYSLDWVHQYAGTRDRALGLSRLRRLIQRYGSQAYIAMIYDNTSQALIESYKDGILQQTPINPTPYENSEGTL